MIVDDGRKRVVIDYVGPQVDGGRFPIKRAVGETIKVVAHAFADGQDHIRVEMLHRRQQQSEWTVREMAYEVNDEWSAAFPVAELGGYVYTVRGWVDRFGTWQSDLQKKFAAAQEITIELRMGADLLRDTARHAEPADATKLAAWAELFETPGELDRAVETALSDGPADIMHRYPDRSLATTYDTELAVIVDRPQAVYSAWYELFPRSVARAPDVQRVAGVPPSNRGQDASDETKQGGRQ